MRIAGDFSLQRGRFELAAVFESDTPGVTALCGPSGAGKSTLLRAIAGLERPQRGWLAVGDACWFDASRNLAVPPTDRGIGYVTQEPNLFPHLSVRRNLEYGARRRRDAQRRMRFDDVVAALGLEPLIARSIGKLSGGERQRVAIGRALLRSPSVLLLDGPVSALDATSRREVLDYIERVLKDLSVRCLVVTHDLRDAGRLAAEMLWIERGRIVAQGAARDVLTDPRLPFAALEDAESIFEAVVVEHDAASHLTRLTFAGGDIWAARRDVRIGERVRVQIAARDVSLALERPQQVSILNVFAGSVRSLGQPAGEPAHELVQLDIADTPLLARITVRSSRALELEVGQRVWALVKSVALLP
jgi:molybdate transport system ATP-binding protein